MRREIGVSRYLCLLSKVVQIDVSQTDPTSSSNVFVNSEAS